MYYLSKYFMDFVAYPFIFERFSRVVFEDVFYQDAVEFFLKKENRKLIIPE